MLTKIRSTMALAALAVIAFVGVGFSLFAERGFELSQVVGVASLAAVAPAAAMPKTLAELEQFVRDNVSKESAAVATKNMERAAAEMEDIRSKMRDPNDLQEFMRVALERRRERATVDSTGRVVSDPLRGRGLGFARLARILTVAASDRCNPEEACSRLADTARNRGLPDAAEGYERVVADLKDRGMSLTDFAAGGSLAPQAMASEFIELLYARTVVLALGARTMDIQGSLDIGKINSGASIGYTTEGGNIVPTQMGTGKLRLVGKKAAAIVGLTNELLRNPSVGADAVLRDDLLQAMGLLRDLSALRGTGGDAMPNGVRNQIVSGNKFNSTGTTIAQKVADLAKAMRLVDESNVPLESGGWVMSPRSFWALFATLDGNSQFVFAAQLVLGLLFGFPAKTTTQVPNNLGGGSDSEVYFGAWQDLIVGFDTLAPLQVESFPGGTWNNNGTLVSGISTDQTPVRIIEGHDMLLRHNNTFALIEQVAWT